MFKDACWPNVTFLTVDFNDNMMFTQVRNRIPATPVRKVLMFFNSVLFI